MSRSASGPPGGPRSLIVETTTRAVFHTILVFSVFLLFAGHNAPGGGFVGGLVAAAALVLVYAAWGSDALRSAVAVRAETLLGLGLLAATGTGLAAFAFGADFLAHGAVEATLPLLGHVKVTSALAFDAGVYLVVVGLVLGVLTRLGGAMRS